MLGPPIMQRNEEPTGGSNMLNEVPSGIGLNQVGSRTMRGVDSQEYESSAQEAEEYHGSVVLSAMEAAALAQIVSALSGVNNVNIVIKTIKILGLEQTQKLATTEEGMVQAGGIRSVNTNRQYVEPTNTLIKYLIGEVKKLTTCEKNRIFGR